MIKFDEKSKNEICSRYLNGESPAKIAVDFNVSRDTIRRTLKRQSIKFKSTSDAHKKYEIDENYFQKINTEDKAYFLGLMFADGYNNTKKGEAKITLHSGDTEILNIFREKLKTNKPLRNDRGYIKLAIENKKMSSDLAKHGCVKAKTFIIKFPKLRKDLVRHFIRGYFDGDGCITQSGKYPIFSIVSTEKFLISIQNFLIKELKLSKTKLMTRHPERNHSIRTLVYGSFGNCIPIYHYLYDNSSIFFERKKRKFETFL
jgi:hypothetical protein